MGKSPQINPALTTRNDSMKIVRLSPLVSVFLLTAASPAVLAQADSRLQIPATDEGLPGSGPIRRYDWVRKLWLERRSVWAARVEQDEPAVVFLGGWSTQGWG